MLFAAVLSAHTAACLGYSKRSRLAANRYLACCERPELIKRTNLNSTLFSCSLIMSNPRQRCMTAPLAIIIVAALLVTTVKARGLQNSTPVVGPIFDTEVSKVRKSAHDYLRGFNGPFPTLGGWAGTEISSTVSLLYAGDWDISYVGKGAEDWSSQCIDMVYRQVDACKGTISASGGVCATWHSGEC